MSRSHTKIAFFAVILAVLSAGIPSAAWAVSCTMSPAMSPDARTTLAAAARKLGQEAADGDSAALQAGSAPVLKDSFGSISSTVSGLAQSLKGAAITVNSLYLLDAGDLQGTQNDVDFFCSAVGSPLVVTVSFGELPSGVYALAIVHASGVPAPQQFAFILQNMAAPHAPAQWDLAGFFVRPLTIGGHSGVWFWDQARAMQTAGAPLSSYIYYQAAVYLARPTNLYTSANMDRLNHEMTAVAPAGLPGAAPMQVNSPDGSSFAVTGLRIDTTLGPIDLRVDAKVPTIGDPVSSRKSALSLMAAMVARFPHLRDNFHGIWVYETAANGQTYAVEQPMSAIR
jgi:hypothetical protein